MTPESTARARLQVLNQLRANVVREAGGPGDLTTERLAANLVLDALDAAIRSYRATALGVTT